MARMVTCEACGVFLGWFVDRAISWANETNGIIGIVGSDACDAKFLEGNTIFRHEAVAIREHSQVKINKEQFSLTFILRMVYGLALFIFSTFLIFYRYLVGFSR